MTAPTCSVKPCPRPGTWTCQDRRGIVEGGRAFPICPVHVRAWKKRPDLQRRGFVFTKGAAR